MDRSQALARVQAIIETLTKLTPNDARRQAFLLVRDLQYGDIESRDPFDVFAAKKGTCSGKHALLRMFLERLGYEVESWFALHDFRQFPMKHWPDILNDFRSKVLTDYHDFLKVRVNGEWVTVDAVFDRGMERLGFPVTEWDGATDVLLPIRAEKIFRAETDVEAQKKRLIGELPASVQTDRKTFLAALTRWLDAERPNR